jgi:peptidoglycan/LPS O-acetylase OafA/YrhL
MSVHAVLARPVFRTSSGRHAKPRPAWPRVAGRAVFLVTALICAVAVIGFGWSPVLLVVPSAAFALLVASVAKLRTASRKIDTIFAEELSVVSPDPIDQASA